MSRELIDLRPRRGLLYTTNDKELHFIYRILRTCRSIHHEVKKLLFAENYWVVSSEKVEYGLNYLGTLSPYWCSFLNYVYVELYFQHSGKPVHVLDVNVIAAWDRHITYFLSNIQPHRLHLTLVCETKVSSITTTILQPLLDRPRALRDLQLHLHVRSNDAISSFARRMAMQILGQSHGSKQKPFRFFELPIEIRQHILEYTNLVAPMQEIQWTPDVGFYFDLSRDWRDMRTPERDMCEESWNKSLECYYDRRVKPAGFCYTRNSGFSLRCCCWTPPTSFMITSRAMYEESIAVFYSKNRVIITPDYLFDSLDHQASNPRFNAFQFLTRHMWPHVLRHLRVVEFVFPLLEPSFCSLPTDAMYQDWQCAINHLKEHATLAGLTLIAYIGLAPRCLDDPPDGKRWSWNLEESRGKMEDLIRAQASILKPLQLLRQMKSFIVYLEYGWHSDFPDISRSFLPQRKVAGKKHHQSVQRAEIWLEKLVMGRAYDSRSLGRLTDRPSQWLWSFHRRGDYE